MRMGIMQPYFFPYIGYFQLINSVDAFVIYDNVPGGAGHVARVYDHLYDVFLSARNVVSSCECGEDTSCYSCLRNYRNQFVHDKLTRGSAMNIISGTLE